MRLRRSKREPAPAETLLSDAQNRSRNFSCQKRTKLNKPPPLPPQKGETGGGLFGMDVRECARERGGEVELFSQPNSQKTVLVWCCGKFGRAETGTKGDNIKCDGNIEKGYRAVTCQQSGCEPTLPFLLPFTPPLVLGPASPARERLLPAELAAE